MELMYGNFVAIDGVMKNQAHHYVTKYFSMKEYGIVNWEPPKNINLINELKSIGL
jgi:hypothetical protein